VTQAGFKFYEGRAIKARGASHYACRIFYFAIMFLFLSQITRLDISVAHHFFYNHNFNLASCDHYDVYVHYRLPVACSKGSSTVGCL
jgi:hypothetical protein